MTLLNLIFNKRIPFAIKVLIPLKNHHGIDYADVRLYNHKRSIEFLAVDLKLVNATQLEIDGLQSS